MKNDKILNINSKKSNKNTTIQGDTSYYRESYYTENIYLEGIYEKLVRSVESIVRKSDEYTAYIGFLKNEVGLNSSAILGNISDDGVENVRDNVIEFHHYPFTLYDISSIVMEKMFKEGEPINTFRVAKQVILEHQNHNIGLVPLDITSHELTHAGELFINLSLVFGRYDRFIEEYNEYIPSPLKANYYKIIEMSAENTSYSQDNIYDRE